MADDEKTNEQDEAAEAETPEAEATPAQEEAPEAAEPEAAEPEADAAEAAEPEPASAESEPEPEAEPEPASAEGDAAGAEGDAAGAEGDAAAEDEDASAEAEPAPKRSRKRLPRRLRHKHSKPKRERSAERKPIVRTPKPESEPGRRQERRGIVVSDKGDKTIVVQVDMIKAHRKYKKVVRRTRKFHAHDEANAAAVGDTVRIVETRPLSKTKNWRLAEIVERAK